MENVYKDTGCKDWENGLFYENINLLLNWIAQTNADTLPSSKFASPSKVATLDDLARGTKCTDIPGTIQGYWGRWNSDFSWVLLNS